MRSTISCRRPTARRLRSASRPADRKQHRCSSTTRRPARRSPDPSTAPSSAPRRGARIRRRCTSSASKKLGGRRSTDRQVSRLRRSTRGICDRNRCRFWAARSAAARSSIRWRIRCSWSFPARHTRCCWRSTACRTSSPRGSRHRHRVEDPNVVWQPFFDRDDGITSFELRGDEVFLLSHHDAPTFKVLSLRVGAPLASASTLVAPQPNRLIESIHAASDALYVLTLDGIYSHLLRIPTGSTDGNGSRAAVRGLRFGGVRRSANAPGITITQESWTVAAVDVPIRSRSNGAFTASAISARTRRSTHGVRRLRSRRARPRTACRCR